MKNTLHPRLAALTDDLTPDQFQALLQKLMHQNPNGFFASLKKFRRDNGLSDSD